MVVDEVANYVEFHAAVVSDDLGGLAGAVHLRGLGGHLGHEVALVGVVVRDGGEALKFNTAEERASVPDLLGQAAGVDAVEGRDSGLLGGGLVGGKVSNEIWVF